jgi:ABC-type bacteriocin/lantibiotic exporter with double-glycine peptidase domain
MMSNITKLYNFLDSTEKNSLYIFIFISLMIAALEATVLFIIFPLILFIFDMTFDRNIEKFFFFKYLDIYYLKDNLNLVATVVLFYIIFKSLFAYYIKVYQINLIFKIVAKYQKKILFTYLNQPYIFFTQRRSSDLIHYVNGEAVNFSMNFVGQIFLLISELVIVLILLSFLMIINFNITLLALLFISFSLLIFNLLFKNKILLMGRTRLTTEMDRVQYLQELFKGIKEIIMDDLVRFFYIKIKKNITLSTNLNARILGYNFFPKSILEILVFGLIVGFVIFNNNLKNISHAYTFVTFIYAIYRIIPNLLTIISSSNLINYAKTSSVKIMEEFKKLQFRTKLKYKKKKLVVVKEIFIKELFYKYPNTKNYIIKNLNLKIKNGEKIFINGDSGVGKTTLINLICGLLKPTKGIILFNKQRINNYKITRDNISLISQNFNILNLSIKSNIILNQPYNKKKFNDALIISGLQRINIMKNNQTVGENGIKLSGGQRQRLLLARALYRDRQILIFDEGLNALEKVSKEKILRHLQNLKNKIIIYLGHEKYNNAILKNFRTIKITNE